MPESESYALTVSGLHKRFGSLEVLKGVSLLAREGDVISMTKATALVSLVTLWDVLSVALKIRNDTLVTYAPLLVAGAIYFVLNFFIARVFIAVEYRLSPHQRPRPS